MRHLERPRQTPKIKSRIGLPAKRVSATCQSGVGESSIFNEPLLSDPLFYAAAIPAIVLLGLAKGGFAGLGILAVPLLSLVLPPVQAAAITLPILIAQDVVSIWMFRGNWDLKLVGILLIGAVAGVVAGFALAAWVSTAAVEAALGIITALFGMQRLWIEREGAVITPSLAPPWAGVLFGVAAGFTSQIAHAGGPPAQMYLMPRQLGRDLFIGTSTLFFTILNWIKVPAYLALGQFTRQNLVVAGAMLPLAIGSTVLGAYLVRRVSGRLFYQLMYVLMILVGMKLTWDGVSGLL
jgi:uncharacterized protein